MQDGSGKHLELLSGTGFVIKTGINIELLSRTESGTGFMTTGETNIERKAGRKWETSRTAERHRLCHQEWDQYWTFKQDGGPLRHRIVGGLGRADRRVGWESAAHSPPPPPPVSSPHYPSTRYFISTQEAGYAQMVSLQGIHLYVAGLLELQVSRGGHHLLYSGSHVRLFQEN
ncbi:hypothetical protein EVAR_86003_1 [Eumeta japonica]|uniref:Uncharacterized protein n=1 Tax=Eumeta variegata TaxID=151549 RepID=A0A4C1UJ48_EUMVA|nr:hypothetical protein EVAR_86003_1 [Eumeta japonica]